MSLMRVFSILLLSLWVGPVSAFAADKWPDKPVRLLIPYPPGGASDLVGRTVAEGLTKMWGQSVMVENKPGAVETLAAGILARSKPDGYTLMQAGSGFAQLNEFIYTKLPYDAEKDFSFITRMVEMYSVFVVRADSEYKTMADIMAAAKDRPDQIVASHGGLGSLPDLSISWVSELDGHAKFRKVPYGGAAPAIQAVLAGDAAMTVMPYAAVAPFITSNQLRAIAVTSKDRLKSLPDVPSLTELGYRDSVIPEFFSIVGPAALPKELVDKIAADVKSVLMDPSFTGKLVERYEFTVLGGSPEEYVKFRADKREVAKAWVAASGVKLTLE